MAFFKALKKTAASAAGAIAHSIEIDSTDRIVEKLLQEYDTYVKDLTATDHTFAPEEASQLETTKFAQLNQLYDERAKKSLNRDPVDDKDVIAVRKRILNRGLKTREGQIAAISADRMVGITLICTNIMKGAVDSLRECEDKFKTPLPSLKEDIIREFELVLHLTSEAALAAFPNGFPEFQRYSTGLSNGLPSWEEFKAMVTAAKTATLEANAALIETVLQQERDQFVFEMNERLDEAIRAVMTNIRTEIGESVRDFLDVSANDAAISSLIGEVRRREATLLSR